MPVSHTYMRDPMPGGMRATCSLCVRPIEVHADGRLVRHGWKERGRKAGEYGLGMQFGKCPATGDMPLEQTDQDGLRHIELLTQAQNDWLKNAEEHKAGHDQYTKDVEATSANWDAKFPTDSLGAWMASGLAFSSRTHTKRATFSGHAWPVETRTYTVPRGFQGVERHGYNFVPSYEQLRSIAEDSCRAQARALGEAIRMLRKAIKHHAATEPERKVEVHTATVHMACRPYRAWGKVVRASCGSPSLHAVTTEDTTLVTCSRCILRIGVQVHRKAEQAAVEALAARVEEYLRTHKATSLGGLKKAMDVADTKTMNRALEHLDGKSRVRKDFGKPAKWSFRDIDAEVLHKEPAT